MLVRVRRRAKAHVVLAVPVDVIVATLVTGLRPVRNLLPEVTVLIEHFTDEVVSVGRRVLVGVTSAVSSEWGRGLGRQSVATDVGRRMFEGEQVVQGVLNVVETLGP